MPDAAVGLVHAQLMMVCGVPYGAGLIGHCGVNFKLLGSVECGAQGNHLREYGYIVIAYSVAGLIPPVVGRNVKTVNRYGTVHHQADLFLRGKKRKQVVGPLVK